MVARPQRPRVTVLMPVHNASPYLRQAIDSVLSQTWRDFELLVLDDGSDDGSGAIADACAGADRRIRVEHLPRQGLVATLNHGLDRIDTELIARADADDVNLPDRLARQVAYLDARPEIGVCGSWLAVDPAGTVSRMPEDPDQLSGLLLFITPIYNPTALLRREWLARAGVRFDARFPAAEDYEFWERANRLTRLANVPAVLLRYRQHAGQVTATRRAQQLASSAAVRHRQLLALGLEPGPDECALHEEIAGSRAGTTPARLAAQGEWLERLRDANRVARRYPEPAFTEVLAGRWYRLCALATERDGGGAHAFQRSSLAAAVPGAWYRRARLHVFRFVPRHLVRRALQFGYRVRHRGIATRTPRGKP